MLSDEAVNVLITLQQISQGFLALMEEDDLFLQLESKSSVDALRSAAKMASQDPLPTLAMALMQNEYWHHRVEKFVNSTTTCKVHHERLQSVNLVVRRMQHLANL